MNTYWTFKIYSFVPLKGGATTRMHNLRLSTDCTTYFSAVFRHFPGGVCSLVMYIQCRILLQSKCTLTIFYKNATLTFLFVYLFYTIFVKFYINFINFYVRQIGREMMPCVKENNPPSSQKIDSLDLEEK